MLDIQGQIWLIVAIESAGMLGCCPKAGDYCVISNGALASVRVRNAGPWQRLPFHPELCPWEGVAAAETLVCGG